MKKLTKLLALTMTGGMLLVGCVDADDVEEDDLPAIEDMEQDPAEDPADEELDEETE